ncbi:MAG: hypothetical protein JRH20_05270 [Deltaproteobacteria bacterium]|nr:hypothetical protein [Deltaproteobacteria bacterium]
MTSGSDKKPLHKLKSPRHKRITESLDPQTVNDTRFLQELIDTFPAMTFVVEEDVTVVAFNTSASRFFGIKASALKHLTGQLIYCVNAMGGTCRRTLKCKDCDLRLALERASQGVAVERKQTTMKLAVDGEPAREFHLLVTTKPYRGPYPKVLLFIENVTEHVLLERLLPALEKCPHIAETPYYRELLENYRGLREEGGDKKDDET